jgi:ABC-type proline/glycine betaine transport system permease subunit
LPSPVNLFKAVGAGGLGYAAIVACNQLEVPWLLSLLLAGVVYLVVLALTRAIPPELIASVLRRRDTYQRSA